MRSGSASGAARAVWGCLHCLDCGKGPVKVWRLETDDTVLVKDGVHTHIEKKRPVKDVNLCRQ